MKLPKSVPKSAIKGKSPSDSHGAFRFGRDFDVVHGQAAWQTAAYLAGILKKEKSVTGPKMEKFWKDWWREAVLHHLGDEFREAIKKMDGGFFRALAIHIEAFSGPDVDPLRAWISRLFYWDWEQCRREEPRLMQDHSDKTSNELLELYKIENKGDPVALNEFTRALREQGVQWKKAPGGAPCKNRPKNSGYKKLA